MVRQIRRTISSIASSLRYQNYHTVQPSSYKSKLHSICSYEQHSRQRKSKLQNSLSTDNDHIYITQFLETSIYSGSRLERAPGYNEQIILHQNNWTALFKVRLQRLPTCNEQFLLYVCSLYVEPSVNESISFSLRYPRWNYPCALKGQVPFRFELQSFPQFPPHCD